MAEGGKGPTESNDNEPADGVRPLDSGVAETGGRAQSPGSSDTADGLATQGAVPPVDDTAADEGAETGATESVPGAGSTRVRRRVATIAGSGALAVLILGTAAFAVWRIVFAPSVNPADRLPESVAVYLEVNLDPSFDQTPKLFDLIDSFGGLDEFESDVQDFDDILHEALAEVDLDFLEPEELTSWVGTRAAVAGGVTGDDELYGALALASRDDEAAALAMEKIAEEAGDEFGYVVDEGLVTIVVAESDPQDLASELVADGRRSPLAEADGFAAAVNAFDGDQLMFMWIDSEKYIDAATEILGQFENELAAEGMSVDQLMSFYESAGWAAVGVAATDVGIDIRAHYEPTADGFEFADWRAQLGELRLSQVGGVLSIPDGDFADEINAQLDLVGPDIDELSALLGDEALPNLEFYDRGLWEYDLALSEADVAEYDALFAQWEDGELIEGDAEFDRLVELDEIYALFGEQATYDQWAASNGDSAARWMFELALSHDEYREMDALDTLFNAGELAAADEQHYFDLLTRLYAFGVVSDYEFYESTAEPIDVRAIAEEILDVVIGGSLVFTVDDVFGEPDGGVEFTVAEGPADRILELPESGDFAKEMADQLGDDLVFEGSTVTFGEMSSDSSSLAEHPSFDAAFADAPTEAVFAIFVDVASLNDTSPEPQDWLEHVSAISMVWGVDEALIGVLVD